MPEVPSAEAMVRVPLASRVQVVVPIWELTGIVARGKSALPAASSSANAVNAVALTIENANVVLNRSASAFRPIASYTFLPPIYMRLS